MLHDDIKLRIIKTLGVEPTVSQQQLFEQLAEFTLNDREEEILLIKGYAGTGKTTGLSAYVKVLNSLGFKIILLAPTGRAAKVFSAYSGVTAYTIHKKVYRQRSSKDGFGRFVLDKNLHSRTIFIVDEASMISNQKSDGNIFGSGLVLNDLVEYVHNKRMCKLILTGDTAQLPPVGLDISPALDAKEVAQMCRSVKAVELVDVVRQSKSSGILENASQLRYKISSADSSVPLLSFNAFDDIQALSGSDLIEKLAGSYAKKGINETLVICRSNKRANRYNQGIRNQILGREEELSPGDLLMVVKNNYFWLSDSPEADFIANGDIVEVLKIHRYTNLYGFRFAHCTIRLIDYNLEIEAELLLDALHSESAALNTSQNKELFYSILEDYSETKPKRKQFDSVKSNAFFNALQVKYAYAVTCHKAQGGQWKEVYVDSGYITRDMVDIEFLRWLYTAITRATEKVYMVNFPAEFTSQ
jgi:exodeoxyribonuclease-5